MSGFVSVELIIEQSISGILAPFRKPLLELERQTNPDYANFDARESLKDAQAKVLLIYSSNDSVVSKNVHYDALQKALSGKPNIRFLLVHGKDHSPNYTADAVKYKNEFFTKHQEAKKKKQLQTPAQKKKFMAGYDWRRMTAQDSRVWTIILDYLKA
jgi:pimeloyl-ACP methyl ester carboxylesterase